MEYWFDIHDIKNLPSSKVIKVRVVTDEPYSEVERLMSYVKEQLESENGYIITGSSMEVTFFSEE